MSGEKHNNQNDLKNKLDTLYCLPDEAGTDKELIWEKLYSRLHEKSSRRWMGRRWVGAACVSLIIAVSFRIFSAHERREPVNGTANAVIVKPLTGEVAILPHSQELPKSLLVKNKKPIRTIHAEKPFRQTVVQTTIPSGKGPAEAAAVIPVTAISSVPAVADPVVSGKPVVVLAKKKLRIVHINEVDEPVEEDKLAKYSAHHVFRIRWFEHPNPLNASLENDHSAYEMLKINLSSPN